MKLVNCKRSGLAEPSNQGAHTAGPHSITAGVALCYLLLEVVSLLHIIRLPVSSWHICSTPWSGLKLHNNLRSYYQLLPSSPREMSLSSPKASEPSLVMSPTTARYHST